MSRGRSLAPGEGFAAPLFGQAEPAALQLFATIAPEAPQPPEPARCAACGSIAAPGHSCGASALTLPNPNQTGETMPTDRERVLERAARPRTPCCAPEMCAECWDHGGHLSAFRLERA